MIVILGESASGKSTVEKILSDTYKFKRIISYTTRPIREGEKNGVDYHFVTTDIFKQLMNDNFFAETGEYRGWYYGTAKEDYTDDKVCVVTPSGLRQLKNNSELNIVSFYIKIDRRDRLIKLLKRGDEIEECYRRSLSDVGQFDGIEKEIDFIIINDDYKLSPNDIAMMIYKKVEGVKN